MFTWLWLVPGCPLAAFLLLLILGRRMNRTMAAIAGVAPVGFSACVSGLILLRFIQSPPPLFRFTQTLWSWFAEGQLKVSCGLYLDALSALMIVTVSAVAFLIFCYAVEYMRSDAGFTRFFAYLNLFVFSMLLLLLADNLILLYLGWEGVGLCSYLLIGFWYEKAENGRAARKAFIITRIGDTSLLIAFLMIFKHMATFNIQAIMTNASVQWAAEPRLALLVALLILGGAIGKSAQLPLQTWLPDAMAGPTPVSALLHAATMVTAGVYLIARCHALFILAPVALAAVALVGLSTLLLAGFSALVQTDFKRVLAYSTISQIGYMFLALGVGAWWPAIFHFFTHAFFKALLFLAAGAVINALQHEQNIFRMGGLHRQLPAVFWPFLAGSAALAALPLIGAGFYSKDAILWQVWHASGTGPLLWLIALLGAFLTALYTFRLVFLVFFGHAQHAVTGKPGYFMTVPLAILACFAIGAGFVDVPATLGGLPLLSNFLATVFPAASIVAHGALEAVLQVVAALIVLLGVALAYVIYGRRRSDWASRQIPMLSQLQYLWAEGWGFDRFYQVVIVGPYNFIAHALRCDVVDRVFTGIAALALLANSGLARSQNGRMRWYIMVMTAGAIVLFAMLVLV